MPATSAASKTTPAHRHPAAVFYEHVNVLKIDASDGQMRIPAEATRPTAAGPTGGLSLVAHDEHGTHADEISPLSNRLLGFRQSKCAANLRIGGSVEPPEWASLHAPGGHPIRAWRPRRRDR